MAETSEQKEAQSETVPVKSGRNTTLIKVTVVLVLLALVWVLYWLLYLRFYEYTDDAYLNGNMVYVNAPVAGSVVAYYADDTDYVEEGQLLVLLDDTLYRLEYEKELVNLTNVAYEVSQLYDTVAANAAAVEYKKAAFAKAKYDFGNRAKLVGSKAVSDEDYTHAKEALQMAEADLKQAEASLEVAKDAAGETPPGEHPRIEKQKAAIRSAYYNLQNCAIYAPSSGYIAQRTVQVGQWATHTTNLLAVIPIDYVWVDANYKETQLADMRIGQPATIWVDLYGSGVEFKGKVLGIASGTGSVFSIIPPQNATGNWIKIVQRLPVRVSLDKETLKKFPPRVGLSVEVNVDISNQNLPYLSQGGPVRPVAKTTVFEVDFTQLEEAMNKLVRIGLNRGSSKEL